MDYLQIKKILYLLGFAKMDKAIISLPIVSIAIPCFNHETYLSQAIRSVLDQTYSNIELIILDDGSKDDASEVLRKLEGQFIWECATKEFVCLGYKNFLKRLLQLLFDNSL